MICKGGVDAVGVRTRPLFEWEDSVLIPERGRMKCVRVHGQE